MAELRGARGVAMEEEECGLGIFERGVCYVYEAMGAVEGEAWHGGLSLG